ncbi:hypothetical protein GGI07_001244 [Coemansia sp. Benny D115]|nr:hypothetical protein GGI07_001244 [Coemansia sp. Benny D115]
MENRMEDRLLVPRASSSQFYTGPINPLFTPGEYTGLFIVNGVSILCSLFVVGFIHMYRNTILVMAASRQRGKRRTIRRPVGTQAAMYLSLPASLRLLFIASIIDVLYSGFRIYNLIVSMPGFSGDKQDNCEASMTGVTFFNLFSVFVRALLSVHLQLVILNNVSRALAYERHFLVASAVISAIVSVIPLFTHNYVWIKFDPTIGSAHCGYFPLHRTTDDLDDVPSNFVWTEEMAQKAVQKGLVIMWSTNFAWVTLTVFYGAMVIVSVVIRLAHQRNTLNRIADGQGLILEQAYRRKREFFHTAAKVVRRILQFPMMVVVCHILEVVYGMVTLSLAVQMMRANKLSSTPTVTNQNLTRLYLASQFMLGMEGIITLFFLPLEPPIRLMLRRQYLRRKSDLRRLGTTRKSVRHRNVEHWPSARPRTLLQQLEYSGDLAGTERPSWGDNVPTVVVSGSAEGGEGVDHFVTKTASLPGVLRNPGSSSNVNNAGKEDANATTSTASVSPFRAATVKWLKKPGSRTIRRPEPIHRSHTLDEFPWDVVAIPRSQNRGESNSPAAANNQLPLSEYDIASTVLAMRNDGLPSQQWYIPASLSRAATASEPPELTPDFSGHNTLVSASPDGSTHDSNTEP